MKNLLQSLLFGGLLMVVFTACQNDETYVEPQEDLMTIEETLLSITEASEAEIAEQKDNANLRFWRKRRPTYRTLLVALARTGLLRDALLGELTLLAPSDDAFKSIGITTRNVKDVPNLKEILLYHVIDGKVRSTDLVEGYAPTLNGASVRVSLDGGVFFNNTSEVIRADIHTFRGVLHLIDEVLIPPTLVGIVQGNENFTILEAALTKANLIDTLNDPDANFTVFAPTDAAFAALLEELGLTAEDLLNDSRLSDVLLYHVLSGRVFSTDLAQDLTVDMANGGEIRFDLTGAPFIEDEKGRQVFLNTGLLDIGATNGVVHVINHVLRPASL